MLDIPLKYEYKSIVNEETGDIFISVHETTELQLKSIISSGIAKQKNTEGTIPFLIENINKVAFNVKPELKTYLVLYNIFKEVPVKVNTNKKEKILKPKDMLNFI